MMSHSYRQRRAAQMDFFARASSLTYAGLGLVALLTSTVAAAQSQCRPTDIVHADARAMSGSSAAEKLAIFTETAQVFSFPDDKTRLTGDLSKMLGTHEQRRAAFESFATLPPQASEVIEIAEVGNLAIAKLRITRADGAGHSFLLAGFRVANCKIAELWHIARSDTDEEEAAHKAVINRLVATNNAGDLEGFLDVFAPGLLFYRNSGVSHAIGDKPSKLNGNPQGRRDAFAVMFANGAPGQATAEPVFSVGDLAVSRDTIALQNGKILDEISIYRIGGGKITHDWLIAVTERGGQR